jgi:hypothetical protein
MSSLSNRPSSIAEVAEILRANFERVAGHSPSGDVLRSVLIHPSADQERNFTKGAIQRYLFRPATRRYPRPCLGLGNVHEHLRGAEDRADRDRVCASRSRHEGTEVAFISDVLAVAREGL